MNDRDDVSSSQSVQRRCVDVDAPALPRLDAGPVRLPVMDHHPKFEHSRFLGDKRTQLVYDLESWDNDDVINEFVDLGVALSFGPDTLAEARNRGYTLATVGAKRMKRAPRA